MKKAKNIRNLDSLDRELYRLKLEAKNLEDKLDRNLDHLQEDYLSMTMNSFLCKHDNKNNGNNEFWKSFVKNNGFNSAVNTIAGSIAAKASEGLSDWMSKFLHKKTTNG
jgi:hypothetical protein